MTNNPTQVEPVEGLVEWLRYIASSMRGDFDGEHDDWAAQIDGVMVSLQSHAEREAKLVAEIERLLRQPDDVEMETALYGEGIFVWGPDGDRFDRMFKVIMDGRRATLAKINGGESDDN